MLKLSTLTSIVIGGFIMLVLLTVLLQTAKSQPKPQKAAMHESVISEHTSKNGYTVYEIRGLLTKDECQELISMAKAKGLEDSSVWSFKEKTGNTYDKTHRKSKQTWIDPKESETARKVSAVSATMTGIPVSHQELIQIAMYEKEGMFNAHFDACSDTDKAYCDEMNNHSGQRRTTLLIYLNDEFEGGETEFVDIGVKIKPETGKAILFYNTYGDDTVILDSQHRGCPVLSGEKWICNVWTHSKQYKDKP